MADLTGMLQAAAGSEVVPETTGSGFDPGINMGAYLSSYTSTITVPACTAAIFVVTGARTLGSADTPSLTVDGDVCTEIHSSGNYNSCTTRVYYLYAPSTGSVSYTAVVDTGSRSIATAVIGLDAGVVPSVSSTIFTPTNTGSTGLQTILSLSGNSDELIYCIAGRSNLVDEATSTNTPDSLFSPVAQGLTGSTAFNLIHCSSDIFTSSVTYTVNYDITSTYTALDSLYLIMSW